MGRLYWAYATMPASERSENLAGTFPIDVDQYRNKAQKRQADASKLWQSRVADKLESAGSGRPPKFTNEMGRAAVRRIWDYDSVRWLASEPHELSEVKYLTDEIQKFADQVLAVHPDARQCRRLADHFWCDVVAALAWVLAQVEGAPDKLRDKAIDRLVDEVWKKIRGSRETDWGRTPNGRARHGTPRAEHDRDGGLVEALLKDAVKELLRKIYDGLVTQKLTFGLLVLKLRVIAIWLCPDPMAHALVREQCWAPLMHTWVTPQALLDLLGRIVSGFNDSIATGNS